MFVLAVRRSGADWYVDDPTRKPRGPFKTEGEALRLAVARAPALGDGTSVLRSRNGRVRHEFWTVGSPSPEFPD